MMPSQGASSVATQTELRAPHIASPEEQCKIMCNLWQKQRKLSLGNLHVFLALE